jgi:hypothetical protein
MFVQRFLCEEHHWLDNEHADMLAKSVAHGLPLPLEVFFEILKAPSVV